ncbi:MAG: glycosyltransferase family 39 protein [Leptolyngbyaceae cyanobacterium bins.302]|nr:glycosyltransferase family 39 protein [Leptolyngbyaceae cyanobacterium bins.302]
MTIAKRIPLLALILLLGFGLRFWHLELKPLWMDEVITALFSMGRTYYDVPLEQALPLSAFQQVFTLNSSASCTQITQTVSTQSVHPPLFFCWMHQWLRWLNGLPFSWVWKLRALPALVGVVAIAAVYQLNRSLFTTRAGLVGAAIMAVSPFAVYLSQEARHYTLPMLLVILALCGLYQLLLDLHDRQFRPIIWLGWIAVNSLGFYVHYFFLLAFAAQAVTLIWQGRRHSPTPLAKRGAARPQPPIPNLHALLPFLAIALVCLTYLPWLPTLLSHMNRPETDWVKVNVPGVLAAIAPLFQLVSGWTLAVIALPVENQPVWLAIVNGCLMALFSGWLAWRVGVGLWHQWQDPDTRLGIRMLGMFCLVVIGEFLAIAYLLGKDFTQVPRYNFIYFPAVCALIGVGLSSPLTQPARSTQQPARFRAWSGLSWFWAKCNRSVVLILCLVATFSSVLVISNQVFQKPYNPDQVASRMVQDRFASLLVVSAYNDFQDVALGLSFALQLGKQEQSQIHSVERSPRLSKLEQPIQQQRATEPNFAFLGQFKGYDPVWQQLALMPQPLPLPLNLWIIAPGLKRVGYPQQLTLNQNTNQPQTCSIDPANYYRIGIPYQRYRCQ